jgi:3-keto-disaccharide hydrolase
MTSRTRLTTHLLLIDTSLRKGCFCVGSLVAHRPTRVRRALLLLLVALAPPPGVDGAKKRFTKLFNGRNLDGFDIFLRESATATANDQNERPPNSDPKRVFRVHDGMIHVSGEEWGYILTKQEYENYHLRAEFKWGVATHAPRKNVARDSGILFHVVPPYKVWPASIEFQVIEGRTGEIILVGDGTSLTANGVTRTRGAGGSTRFARVGQGPWKGVLGYRDPAGEVEKPHGEWNLFEVIADGDRVKLLVNGKLVNEGSGAKPSRGRILFQSEGAECFYRNIEIAPLNP